MDLGEELNALYTDVLHNRCIFTVKLSKLICHAPKLGIIFDTHCSTRNFCFLVTGRSEVGHQSRGAVEMNTPFDVSHVTPLTGKVTRHGLQHMGLFLRVGNRHIIESLWHYCLNVPERE